MSTASPQSAAARTDLPYLRRRHRPAAAPAVTPSTPSSTRSELDLSTPALATPQPGTGPVRPAYEPPRTRPDTRTILTRQMPTVTLTPIQSGVGVLTFDAARSYAVGDLRVGCAYRLRSGFSSVLHSVGTPTTAPPQATRPVILIEPGPQRFTLDLVQSRDIDRLVIYAFSGGGPPPNGGITLIATTFGQARIEMSLDRLPPQGVVVLMSLYNIAGEFVLRAEMDEIAGTARDACTAYGYDHITWLDPWTPLT